MLTSLVLEQVEDREDLSVVWDQGFTNHFISQHQLLELLEGSAHDFWLLSSKSLFFKVRQQAFIRTIYS